MSQLYDRTAILTVYTQEQVTDPQKLKQSIVNAASLKLVDTIGTTYSSKQDNGAPGFRIKFHVQKISGETPVPNPAVIEIYNISADSRAKFRLNNLVILNAGYGANAKTIFKGNIRYAVTSKIGPDYVTRIEANDGMWTHQNSMVNLNFSQPTTAQQALEATIKTLLPGGVTQGTLQNVPNVTYQNGITLSGKSIDQLKQLFSSLNMRWTIDNQQVIAVPYGDALNREAIILSPATGLIGIPEQRSPAIDETLVSFKSLLNPDMNTLQLILFASKFVNGLFCILNIVHEGDSFGTEWFTSGECRGKNLGDAVAGTVTI